jgi:hypothetical protein
MMELRRYEDFDDREILRRIFEEVKKDGVSEGWSGPRAAMERIGEALAPHGIRYTDDMRGSWTTADP